MRPFGEAAFLSIHPVGRQDEDPVRQVLTFDLGGEAFGIDVAHVREVLVERPLARLANTPPTLLGMIDLRGEGVPVVDLKAKLGLPSGEARGAGGECRIVVLDVEAEGCRHLVALVADAVHEVADVREVEPPPAFGEAWNSGFMTGLCRRGEAFVTLLDAPRLFAAARPAPAAEAPWDGPGGAATATPA